MIPKILVITMIPIHDTNETGDQIEKRGTKIPIMSKITVK